MGAGEDLTRHRETIIVSFAVSKLFLFLFLFFVFVFCFCFLFFVLFFVLFFFPRQTALTIHTTRVTNNNSEEANNSKLY